MTALGFASRFFRSTSLSVVNPQGGSRPGSVENKPAKPARKKPSGKYAALEPRVMFDAAAEQTFVAAMDAAIVEHSHAADPHHQDLVDALNAEPTPHLVSTTRQVDVAKTYDQVDQSVAAHSNLAGALSVDPVLPPHEVVFIDSGVADPAAIAAAAPKGADIVYLQSGKDGLDQIAAYLNGRTNISALHIISHGQEADLILSGVKIDAAALVTHAADLAVIKAALTDSGDILLYGCDVAKGSDGAAFVEAIAAATGADVAASTDVTGDAALGGNWVLENRVGTIDAQMIDARDWHGVLAPLTITITSAPVVTGIFGTDATTGLSITGVGGTARWNNAGFVGTTAIDLRATVVSTTTAGMAFITQGDDASIVLTSSGDVVLKWEIFATGTNIPAVGSPNFNIVDIDGAGGVPNSREIVVPQLNGLTGYTLETVTDEVASVSAAGVNISGTQNEIANPPVSISQVQFSWQNVSSWTVKYTLNPAAGFINSVFRHDGNGSFTFTSPNTVSLLTLDLDASNNTATGTAYKNTFTEGGTAVSVSDTDILISQNAVLGTTLGSAKIVLTNAQAGDVLTAGTLPAGISATLDTSVTGVVTVNLLGTGTVAAYQNAIHAITFSNTSQNPNTSDRLIEVTATNTAFGTTTTPAVATIKLVAVNDAPTIDADANDSSGLTGADYQVTYTENGPNVPFVDADVTLTDPDNTNLQSATIVVTGLFATDVVSVGAMPSGMAAISDTSVAGQVTVTIVGNATLAQYQTALKAITFAANGENPSPTARHATITVDDGALSSNVANITLNVQPINDPPVIDLDGNNSTAPGAGFVGTYIENGNAIKILDTDATLVDLDSTNLQSATITLTNAQVADVFVAGTLPAGITATVTGTAPGVITIALTGAATVADYFAATNAVVFSNTSENPDTTQRIITVQFTDGIDFSNTATAKINVIAVNDAPLVAINVVNPGDVFVVDSSVADAQSIIDALPLGSNIIVIPAGVDGVTYLASQLSAYSDVTNLHIISHGEAGILHLGTALVTATNAGTTYATAFAQIGSVLTSTADILVYGCQFGQDQNALDALAAATSADIAASTDNTGASSLGGNWKLEAFSGAIESTPVALLAYKSLLAPINTGAWTISGNTATNTASGVTTTIAFAAGTGTTFTSTANNTFNNIPAWSSATVQGAASLATVFTWDTTPENASQAATDSGTGTVTISFSQPITNPIINLDRLGGNYNLISNSSLWTLTTAGATLNKLSGTPNFNVTATTIFRTPNVAALNQSEASMAGDQTAAGSVQVIGQFSSLTFNLTGIGPENGGATPANADGIEIGVRFDPANQAPTVVTPSYTTPEDTARILSGVVFADPDAGSTNVTVTLSVAHGTLALNTGVVGGLTAGQITGGGTGTITITAPLSAINATLNNATGLTYTPAANYNGTDVLNASINDNGGTGIGGPLTAATMANIVVTSVNDAPIIDLNSTASTADTARDNAVIFTEGNAPIKVATLTADVNDIAEADITKLAIFAGSNPDGTAEKVVIAGKTFDLATSVTQTATIGGTTVLIAYDTTTKTFTVTNNAGAANPMAQADLDTLVRSVTYENTSQNPTAGARTLTFTATDSGNLTSPPAVATITVVPVNNPPVVDLNGAGAGTGYTAAYTENGVGISIADPTVSVTDPDNTTLQSATIVLTDPVAGDLLAAGTMPTGITAVYSSATHTVTLTGAGTLADYQLAIKAITFASTSDNPTAAPRHISVTVNDGALNSNTAVTTVNVTPVNDPPVDGNEIVVATEDTPLVVPTATGLLANSTDVDGGAPTITGFTVAGVVGTPVIGTPFTIPGKGDITINADGSYTFTPAPNYFGSVPQITYTVSDGAGGTDTSTLDMSIAGVNDAPLIDLNSAATQTDAARNNSTTFTEGDTPVKVALISADANDLAENDITKLTIVAGSNPDGTAEQVVIAGQTFNLATTAGPVAGTVGSTNVFISYDASTKAFTIINAAGPTTPMAQADLDTLIRGVTYENTSQAPTAGARTLTFTATDASNLTSPPAVATITIVPVNDPPVDGNEIVTATEDTPLVVPAATGLLANTVDPDGGTPTITGFTVAGVVGTPVIGTAFTIPGKGAITINSDGSYTFAPVLNYNGPIPQITYTVSDGAGGTDTSTLDVSVTAVNDPPVDGNELVNVTEDTPVTVTAALGLLANSTDVDGGAPTVTSFTVAGLSGPQTVGSPHTIPGVGDITINLDGSYTFTPALNFAGPVPVITYTVSDSNGGTDTSTLTITMIAVNDPPVDGNEAMNVTEDTPLIVPAATGLLANSVDPDGGVPTITGFTIAGIAGTQTTGAPVTIPGVGDVTINPDGSYSFTPVLNYFGPVPVITYTVSDGAGGTDTSTLALTMIAVNDVPLIDLNSAASATDTARDNPVTFTEGGAPIHVALPSADVNDAGENDVTKLTIVAGGFVDGAVEKIVVAGLTFDPSATAAPQIVTVGSSNMLIAYNAVTKTFTVTSLAGGITPIAQVDLDTLVQGITYENTSQNPTAGNRTLTFTATDAANQVSPPAIATITVVPVNDPPVDGNEIVALTEDVPLVVPAASGLLANSVDPDGGIPTITGFTIPGLVGTQAIGAPVTIAGVGTITINADGSYAFTPVLDYFGAIPVITYTVDDGAGGIDTSTLSLSLTPVNDTPIIDLNSAAAATDVARGNAVTFTEGDAAVAVANVALADVYDQGENDITKLTIVVGSDPDGAAEKVVIASKTFDLATTSTQTATVGGTTVSIAYNATTKTFSVTNTVGAATPMAQADLDTLVRSVTYENTSQNPTAGNRTLSFTVTDAANNVSAPAVATVNVIAVNDPPVDGNEIATATEDTPLVVPAATGLLANSVDPDGGTPTITGFTIAGVVGTPVIGTAFTIPGKGDITINGDGSYTFTPALNYNGPIPQITYTVSDGAGGTDTSTLDVSVTAVNDPPVDGNEIVSVTEDTPITVPALTGLLANSTDVDGGTPSITGYSVPGLSGIQPIGVPVTIPGIGIITINATGSYSFAPSSNYAGSVPVITYTVSDGAGGTDTSTLTLNMIPVNDPPVVIDPHNPGTPLNPTPAPDPMNVIPDIATNDGATPTNPNVAQYFVDPDGDPLTFTATGLPPGLTMAPNGTISGTVAPSASQGATPGDTPGTYLVTITAKDGQGGVTTTTVTYSISNLPPVANNDVATVGEDATMAVLGNVITGTGSAADHDTSPDADPLHVSAVNGTAANLGKPVAGSTGGTFVVKADGTWSFDPGLAFQNLNVGQTRDTTITYTVADGQGGFSTATVTVTVTGSNDAPVSLGPIAPVTGVDGSPLTPINVGSSFNNPTALPLTYTATGLPPGLVINPATGVISGTLKPDASVAGPYIVNVTAVAPDGSLATIPVEIIVTNPAPKSVNDAAQTPLNSSVVIAVLANDTDPDHDPLTIASVGTPAHGTVLINPDGTIKYTPTPGYIGPDTFTYTVTDSQGGTSTATVNVNVGAPNTLIPTATPLSPASGTDGQPITPFTVAASFTDPNSDPLTYTATGLPPGLSLNPTTGQVTGTLPADASAHGPYTVYVTAVDPAGNQVTLPMVVTIANPPPVAANDQAATPINIPVTLNVIGNDTDPDADPLAVTAVTQPAHGTVVINPDGTVTYSPAAGYAGPDTFTYSVSDGQGGVAIATVTLNVGGTNPNAPTAGPMPAQTIADGSTIAPINVPTLAGITDPNSDPLVYSAIGLPPGLSINPVTGIISGAIPNDASAHGPYMIQVFGTDPTGAQVGVPFLLSVTNPPPVAGKDHATTLVDQPVNISVLANDADPDADHLMITATTVPSHGTVAVNPDGTIKYTPTAGYIGPDTFTYTITDAQGLTSTATVKVDVGAPTSLSAPPAVAPITGTDGAPIIPVPVTAVFGDPDQTGPLVITVDPTALPPGVIFNPITKQFEGTPANNASQGNTPGEPQGTYIVPVTATDSNGLTTTQFVTFTFTNLPPVAVDDTATTIEDTPVSGNVLTDPLTGDHDTAPDSDPLTVTQFSIAGVAGTFIAGTTATIPNVGKLVINVNGSYTFTPAPNYDGAVPVATYTISDGNGGTNQGTLTLTITPVNDPPVVIDPNDPGTPLNPLPATNPNKIIPDISTTDGGTPPNPVVSKYFVDPEGDKLTFSASNLPLGLTMAPDGTISGVINSNASQSSSPGQPVGTYLVTITADDGHGHPVTTTLTYTIANLPPVAVNDHAIGGTEDAPQSGNVLTDPITGDHDAGPDTDPLIVTAVTGGTVGAPIALAYGSLKLNPNGSWTFTPNALANTLPVGALVQETVIYTISDGNGGTATATLTIDVNGVNDAPTSTPLPPASSIEGSPLSIPTAQVFHDVDMGDVLTFSATGLPPGLMINQTTGVISGTPALGSGGNGPYTVVVSANDGHGGSVPTTFVLKVAVPNGATNQPPPVPLPPQSPPDSPMPTIVPILTPAIDGVKGLGSTPVLIGHVVTEAVDGAASLNSSPGFDSDRDIIQQLVEWAARQGRSASWMHDVLDTVDHALYVGDSLALSLTLDDANLFAVNTMVHQGALFIGVDTLGLGAEVLDIRGANGNSLPSFVALVNNRNLIVNITPDTGVLDLNITGRLPNGRKLVWHVKIDAHSGEILAVTDAGTQQKITLGKHQQPILQAVRRNMGDATAKALTG